MVLEGKNQLIDWGVVHVKNDKNERCIARIRQFMQRYLPDVVVTEHPDKSFHRSARIQRLLDGVRELANEMKCPYRGFLHAPIRKGSSLSTSTTKQEIAEAIAEKFPELASRLPPPRKPWMSEDPRIAMFYAVAIALAYQ